MPLGNLGKTARVPLVALDEVINSRVNLIKIDAEGREWDIIQGSKGVIEAGFADCIYYEFGPLQKRLNQPFLVFHDFFTSRGYRMYRQTISRKYFGLNEIRTYSPAFEDYSSQWMILASKHSPSPNYHGPRITGRIN